VSCTTKIFLFVLVSLVLIGCSSTQEQLEKYVPHDFESHERTAEACLLMKGVDCQISSEASSLTILITMQSTPEQTQQEVYDISTLWCSLTRLEGENSVLLIRRPDGSMSGTSCSAIGNY